MRSEKDIQRYLITTNANTLILLVSKVLNYSSLKLLVSIVEPADCANKGLFK